MAYCFLKRNKLNIKATKGSMAKRTITGTSNEAQNDSHSVLQEIDLKLQNYKLKEKC